MRPAMIRCCLSRGSGYMYGGERAPGDGVKRMRNAQAAGSARRTIFQDAKVWASISSKPPDPGKPWHVCEPRAV